MAIKTEHFTNKSGKKLVKRYSDKGMKIERDGVRYASAEDSIEFESERVYTETDEPIEEVEEVENYGVS